VSRPVINIADLTLESWSKGAKYASIDASFGRRIGMTGMGISYNEVPPARAAAPSTTTMSRMSCSSCSKARAPIGSAPSVCLQGRRRAWRAGRRSGHRPPDHQHRAVTLR
jgi:hypothetical protein